MHEKQRVVSKGKSLQQLITTQNQLKITSMKKNLRNQQ